MNWVPQKLAEAALISKASKWLSPVTSGLKPRPSTPFAQVNFMINDQLPFKVYTDPRTTDFAGVLFGEVSLSSLVEESLCHPS